MLEQVLEVRLLHWHLSLIMSQTELISFPPKHTVTSLFPLLADDTIISSVHKTETKTPLFFFLLVLLEDVCKPCHYCL